MKNFTMGASEQKDASLESPTRVSEQKDAPLESPLRVSEQKDASLESPFGVSEQKDAPLESPFGVSEQKDASLESPLRASEQKDTSLEHLFGAPEPKLLPLESPTAVSLHQRLLKWFPTAAPSGHWPLKCFPTAAPLGHWPLKCFPTAANEWRSPLLAGRVGRKSIHPRCSKQETAACVRKAPIKWFPIRADEWRSPLSAGRVGAQKHTPPMFQTRNGSVCPRGALVWNCPCRGIGWGVCNTPLLLGTPLGHSPIKWFPTTANEWRSPLSAGRVGAYCIRPQTIRAGNGGVWPQGALVYNCLCRGIGWGVCNTPLPLGTPLGHPPIKCFPTAANEWRSPLSTGRVGA